MDFTDKRVLVVGTGVSGVAAIRLLAAKGAKPVVLEGNEKADREQIRAKIPESITYDLIIGNLPEEVMDTLDLAVLSPGVPTDLPFVIKLQDKKIPVWGEIELAYVCGKGRLAAITGTNGKTTTTALTGAIMREYYDSVFVVGNIGLPYTEYALEMKDSSVTVAEVSSFQLETIHSFRPEVSAILNITPDHLNRHHTMQCYIDTKARIAENQTKDQICVLNYEDSELKKLADKIPADIFWFSSARPLERGIWLDGEDIIYKDTEEIKICTIHDMQLLGVHNYENVMAAVAITMHMGVPVECIRKAIAEFKAVEHRIEFVREVHGVRYYNDSKGTNPDAAIKAVQAMVTPTVVIGGGYDKQSSYEEWIDSFGDTVKCLVLLGATADKIEATARKAGFTNIIRVASLEEAVKVSAAQAQSGEAVLLSPACASWDMFKSYEQRGTLFKEYVNQL
ncbi:MULTISPECIES: UDP-N-acetylmuramoyl-L-alanine--D-glutamate ligase [Jutongia]|uniref:UDP-N-acetylmuramoylalanine--D-glutamate ligase n=1 Tax=Jutongia huaianensis TaxID=2763668 RepID=A0ABR7N2W4_9FIRM|nr:UDP-N-acetylmuramoyl-L-alanine--D-glutamate ligase [Jutongia huaianensis]MBC8562971.1 UDP-N-acetylmuramoyl-L-alanine--D-glutamate ligase [Jutongia huaianensis]OKZ83879.1 MAG: UDP-N-acetylmuramoylalanine--D-glutamate ligase [Clostridium sp. 44_14]RHU93502.1 UDP-N-acetylmuramoyl-L-alanine--D-glutamate ligase [Clostridium sp. OM07-9AC]CDE69966.1 uDP-N-acetylmuramoylalanine--D-glutamate ligase [Clostridium sp. CAG:277]